MLEAKREYEKDAEQRVNFFIADTYGNQLVATSLPYLFIFFKGHTHAGDGTVRDRSAP